MSEIADIPTWAENRFALLCSEAGVIHNKSTQDRTGWDYLIEFPAEASSALPIDLRPMGPSARVQVKSKEKGRAEVRLKLSNAIRYAKSPEPCFIVLFLLTSGGKPARIFAKHVWKDFISDVLMRARMADAAGKGAIHRISVTVTFGAEDEHTNDLLPWMRGQIEAVGGQYGEEKRLVEQTVGMEDGGLHGVITFVPDSWAELVDHELGLTPHAPVSRLTMNQRRFGIDAAAPLLEMTPDTVTITREPHACRVRIRGVGGAELWLDGKLRVPSIPGLPAEFLRWRVVADFLDLVVGPDDADKKSTFNLGFNGQEQRALHQLRALTQFLQMALDGPLDVQVRIDGQPAFWGELNAETQRFARWLPGFVYSLDLLELISGPEAPTELTLSIAEIEAARDDIARLDGLVQGAEITLKVSVNGSTDELLKASSLLAYDFANVGEWSFMVVVSRTVRSSAQASGTVELVCENPRVVERLVRRGDGADHVNAMMKLYRSGAFGKDVITLFDGSYREMLAYADKPAPAAK